ncbi:conserved hypothetical protein [Aggregatibacter segnis ATCC 33393]|uniref:Uncharacterized protein n=1 Tax=Aggregatibacter segnis ATCC 33393 TaxID=888057 RepID=E6KXM8_9PAST|nr:conserved hypothetical protein [Aggregatibacter segnis ATCC 33393]
MKYTLKTHRTFLIKSKKCGEFYVSFFPKHSFDLYWGAWRARI